MLVVDTSALVVALARTEPAPALTGRLTEDGDLHAPHLVDVEFLHALRRLLANDALSEDRAADARTDLEMLAMTRYPHAPLLDRAWSLRANLTAYDAVFVALAETLEVPLVTCDARLARAPGLLCPIEVHTD